MKYFLKLFMVIGLAAALVACSEEFLQLSPQGSLDEGTLSNQAGVEAALISAYSMLDGWNNNWGAFTTPWGTAGSNWVWGSVTSDDAYKGSEPGDQGEISQIELFQWTPGNPYFENKFKSLYEGISRANATKNLLIKTQTDKPDEIPSDVAERINGESSFLRAHFHFDAWKMWGNIPYYKETDTDFRKPNNEDVIPLILGDLDEAISLLPATQAEVGRANSWTAKAYKGKVQLYSGDFGGAKTTLREIVDQGPYALQDCFHDIFTTGGENGSGAVLSIQASVNDGTGGGENGNFADRLNFPHGGSPFGCCGFHQPSQNLVNAHKVDADGLPMLNTFNESDVTAADPVDPRLDWTVGRDDVPYLNWGVHDPSWIRSREWAGPYSPKKFTHTNGEESGVGWANVQLSPVNIPIIRFADVILMLAEAEVEAGSLEEARALVNMVRTRAGNCAQGADGGAAAIDDAGITWATYSVGTYNTEWTNQSDARDAVRFERRIELALEGHRFFDLRRWGIAGEVMNAYNAVEATKRTYIAEATTYADRHNLFPLPSTQIELSKVNGEAQLQQNDGW